MYIYTYLVYFSLNPNKMLKNIFKYQNIFEDICDNKNDFFQ